MRGRRGWLIAAVAALALLAASLLVPRPDAGAPLDPRSPGPGGTKAVLDSLRELGHEVSLTDVSGADTIILFEDRLTDETRAAVEDRVRDGARLVLTDPFSPLGKVRVAGQSASDPIGATSRQPGCSWSALEGIGEVRSGRWLDLRPDELDDPAAADLCFPVGDGHGLIRYDLGAGEVVVLSAPGALTNLRLGDEDNAELAVALLVRSRGDRVAVAPPPRPGEGEVGLLDLVPDRVWWALGLAVLLFATVAWERGRRLGAPVEETMPVRVPGSELVHAVGAMLQRSEAHDAAARTVRRSATAELASAVGLAEDAPVELIARRVAESRDLDEGGLLTLLSAPVEDADTLLSVQSGLARIRAAVRETPTTSDDLPDHVTTTGDPQ